MLNWNTTQENPRALLLTAHPDDETIFCGGLLLSQLHWRWHIVCITTETDTRFNEFITAMEAFKRLGVNITNYETLNMADRGKVLRDSEFRAWLAAVKELDLAPDIVFTHNENGEYGHPHHVAANKIAHKLYGNVWDFWCPGEFDGPKQFKNKQLNQLNLNKEILKQKNNIFDLSYKAQKEGLLGGLPSIMKYEFEAGTEFFTN